MSKFSEALQKIQEDRTQKGESAKIARGRWIGTGAFLLLGVLTAAFAVPVLREVREEPAAPGPVVPPETPFFTVQLASYELESRALLEAEKLAGQGHPALVLKAGHHHVLCLGRFAEEREALENLFKLKTAGSDKIYHDAFVRLVKQ